MACFNRWPTVSDTDSRHDNKLMMKCLNLCLNLLSEPDSAVWLGPTVLAPQKLAVDIYQRRQLILQCVR